MAGEILAEVERGKGRMLERVGQVEGGQLRLQCTFQSKRRGYLGGRAVGSEI